jgi:hypothetical protein
VMADAEHATVLSLAGVLLLAAGQAGAS